MKKIVILLTKLKRKCKGRIIKVFNKINKLYLSNFIVTLLLVTLLLVWKTDEIYSH